MAEDAGAVGVCERHDDEIAAFHGANILTNGFNDADCLMSHAAARVAVRHHLVGPEIAAADGGTADDHERVSWLDKAGVGNSPDTNVACAVHEGCAHLFTL